jgi:hypothetical protein
MIYNLLTSPSVTVIMMVMMMMMLRPHNSNRGFKKAYKFIWEQKGIE